MKRSILRRSLGFTLAFGAIVFVDVGAQDGHTEVDCIPATHVDHTEVLDGRTILFYMQGREVYANHLKQECPGLDREERFMYELRTSELCNVDTITVLENWGLGSASGFTCPLGKFERLSREEAEALRKSKELHGRRN